MFRNGHPSSESQNNLKHRYQAWKDDQRRNGSLSNGQTSSDGLDLSIHMPPKYSGNRFEVLRDPSPPPKATDYQHMHRVRHGRGSKEAKKRRDARRNRRKLQAILDLDVQLSRDIDETLSQAKISLPRSCKLPTPARMQSTPSTAEPQQAWTKPTPPQLPYFNFGGLDLIGDCCPQPTPQASSKRVDFGTLTPTFAAPNVPKWLPEQTLLTSKNLKWSGYPLYFDLSKLPEPAPVHTPERSGRELQLWRPQANPPPKKQSRFFPSAASLKPTVKLPPTSCKLHVDNKGIEVVEPPKPTTLAESLEQVVKAAETARNLMCEEESKKNATNLWKILTSPTHPIRTDDDLYPNNASYQPLDDMFAALEDIYDHRLETVGMPVELDSNEIPYVHANCLTGHANERGSEPYPTAEEDITIFEAPANPAHIEEFLGGVDEMVMDPYTDEGYTDAVLAVYDLPPLPASPDIEATAPDPFDSVLMSDTVMQTGLESSDAHFKSEQALFQPHSLTPRTPDDDLVDVATFLQMGHATNCWCKDCGKPPSSLSGEMFVEDETWMAGSSIDDQDWLTWSNQTTPNEEQAWQSWSYPATPDGEPEFLAWSHPTALKEGSASSAWEWEWGSIVDDAEQEIDRAPPLYRPTWDEAFPCKPSAVAHRAW